MKTTDTASDEEREELRGSVRAFFAKHTTPQQIIEWLETEPGYDPATLAAMHDQLALPGIRIPEHLGGMGYGWQELGVVLEEVGRALTGAPLLSGQIAATALLELGEGSSRSRVLPALSSGTRRFTVAGLSRRASLAAEVRAERSPSPERGWVLRGTAHFVIDAIHADTIVVLAETDFGPALFMIASSAPGVVLRPLVAMDMTRPMADVAFTDAPAELISGEHCSAAAVDRLSQLTSLMLAAEQLGGARGALETTVDYVRQRIQFGRQVGSFQAVKHRCADLHVELCGAEAVLAEALRAADDESPNLPVLVHLAAAVCSETYLEVARAAIQLHGGIGFTWEHIAHVHFKRAKTSQLLFGSPSEHRRQLAEIIGLSYPFVHKEH